MVHFHQTSIIYGVIPETSNSFFPLLLIKQPYGQYAKSFATEEKLLADWTSTFTQMCMLAILINKQKTRSLKTEQHTANKSELWTEQTAKPSDEKETEPTLTSGRHVSVSSGHVAGSSEGQWSRRVEDWPCLVALSIHLAHAVAHNNKISVSAVAVCTLTTWPT